MSPKGLTSASKAKYHKFDPEKRPVIEKRIDAVEVWIKEKGFQHGDIVSFDESETRDDDAYIIVKDISEKIPRMIWIKNPNDLQCDYLSIPQDISDTIEAALDFYDNIIKLKPAMNIHLGPKDKFIKKTFGSVPDNWEFDIFFEEGAVNQVHLKLPGKDFYDLGDIDKLSRQCIEKYL